MIMTCDVFFLPNVSGVEILGGKIRTYFSLISHLFLHSPDTLAVHRDSNEGDDLDG